MKKKKSVITPFVFYSFLIPALGGLLFGFDIGSTGVVTLTLGADGQYPQVGDGDKKETFVKGLFTSSSLIGALISAIVAFAIGDALGRKRTLLVGAIFYTLGGTVSALGQNLEMIIGGKIIYGLGIGFAMHSAPVYISEMSPPSVRGLLVSLKEGMIVLGMVLGNFTGFVFTEGEDWRKIFACGGGLGFIFLLGMMTLPYSARWMVLRDYKDRGVVSLEAKQALMRLRGLNDPMEVEGEVQEVLESIDASRGGGFRELLNARKQLVVGIGMVIWQQITGQPSVLYYVGNLLKNEGDSNSVVAAKACMVTSLKLVATLTSVFLVDRLGRKKLLIAGISGMGLMTSALSVVFHYYGTESKDYITIILLMAFVAFYQLGYGPIVWLIISEIFPVTVRSPAVALSVSSNFAFNLVVTFFLDAVINATSQTFTFAMFTVLCGLSALFVIVLVPETKGKTLEEISSLF